MDKAEREGLEASLSEQLGIKVIISEEVPNNTVYIISIPPNIEGVGKEWLVLPAVEVFIKNVFEVVKNATKKRMELIALMERYPPAIQAIRLENLKSKD